MTDCKTQRELLSAIKRCNIVLSQLRFGVSERWVKISKTEALALANAIPAEVTPDDFEMYSGVFGELRGDALYLG